MKQRTRHYTCPDCIREGKPEEQEPEAFYWYQQLSRGGQKRRSSYCIEHQLARSKAWRGRQTRR
jgi:hypothetical protein